MLRTEISNLELGLPYVEYLPENFKKGMPLIVFLHGSGERDNGEGLAIADRHGFNKIFDKINCEFVYLVPQIPVSTFWGAKQETLISFIKNAIKKYDINENKVYLTGVSMGGCATWHTAFSAPELFAAIVPMCGIGYAWLANTLNMPIWVFHGEKDGAISVKNSDEMVEALRYYGKDVTYTRYENVGHNCWDLACNENTLSWILSKQKSTNSAIK